MTYHDGLVDVTALGNVQIVIRSAIKCLDQGVQPNVWIKESLWMTVLHCNDMNQFMITLTAEKENSRGNVSAIKRLI